MIVDERNPASTGKEVIEDLRLGEPGPAGRLRVWAIVHGKYVAGAGGHHYSHSGRERRARAQEQASCRLAECQGQN